MIKERNLNTDGKRCEVCSKDDMPISVASSSIGAISFGYCHICLAMGAEPRGFEEFAGDYTKYEPKEDIYVDKDNKPIFIELNNGLKFKTRREYIDYFGFMN